MTERMTEAQIAAVEKDLSEIRPLVEVGLVGPATAPADVRFHLERETRLVAEIRALKADLDAARVRAAEERARAEEAEKRRDAERPRIALSALDKAERDEMQDRLERATLDRVAAEQQRDSATAEAAGLRAQFADLRDVLRAGLRFQGTDGERNKLMAALVEGAESAATDLAARPGPGAAMLERVRAWEPVVKAAIAWEPLQCFAREADRQPRDALKAAVRALPPEARPS